jgi:5-methylcytosine-specific restriction endonuclease McrA
MTPVDPHDRTTLVLNRNYQTTGKFFTARAAIRNLINGRVKGLDAAGNCVSWTGADVENIEGSPSSLSWLEQTVELYPDQPCLRSAPNAESGLETRWAVPTVVVCTHHFGYHGHKGQSVSLKMLYKMYRGVCQYCLEKIPMMDATKDHVYPKSMGGSNDDFNVVLACKNCNADKADAFPYLNVNGQQVKPRSIHSKVWNHIPDLTLREEWKPFLFQQ